MNLFIDNKSGAPIYDQICAQIKSQIISGALLPDDPLPSIRSLAKDLRISVITTKRAYEELEREGFIYTVAAKGCFVGANNAERLREENLKRIEEKMRETVAIARGLGLTHQDIIDMFNAIKEEI